MWQVEMTYMKNKNSLNWTANLDMFNIDMSSVD